MTTTCSTVNWSSGDTGRFKVDHCTPAPSEIGERGRGFSVNVDHSAPAHVELGVRDQGVCGKVDFVVPRHLVKWGHLFIGVDSGNVDYYTWLVSGEMGAHVYRS